MTVRDWIEEMIEEFGVRHRWLIADALRWLFSDAVPDDPARNDRASIRAFLEDVLR